MSEGKRIIEEDINYHFDWEGTSEIEDVLHDIIELKRLGAEYISCFARHWDADLIGISFRAFKERMETDEEFVARCTKMSDEEKSEREYLKVLIAKYGIQGGSK